jgi:hypothetical protein
LLCFCAKVKFINPFFLEELPIELHRQQIVSILLTHNVGGTNGT